MSGRLFLTLWFLVSFSVGGKYPFILLGDQGLVIGAWLWGLVTCGFVFLLTREFFQKKTELSLTSVQSALLLAYAFLATFVLDYLQVRQFSQYGYEFTFRHFFILGLGAVSLIGLSKKETREKFFGTNEFFTFALFFSIYHEFLSIRSYPADFHRSDMLDALRQAGERLVSGLYLYAPSTGGVGQMPYLPMTVISYLPSTLMNIDLRWMTIVLRTLGAWVIYKHGTKNTKSLMPWIWMHPYINFRHELYIEPFLFFLTMMSLSRGWLARVVYLSIAQLTLHWAWVIFPFVWLRSKGRLFFKTAGVGIVITATGLGFFLLREASLMLPAIFQHTNIVQEGMKRGEFALGFGSLINLYGLHSLAVYLQVLVLAVFGLLALKYKNNYPERFMIPALSLFICCLGFLENYFWIPALYLMALSPIYNQTRQT